MAGRSLVASVAGIKRAKQALSRRSLTQKALSQEIGFAWATVNNFFNRKPIYRTNFEEICKFLHIDWQDIVASSEGLWLQLQSLGSPSQKMGLVLVTEETLGWSWQIPSHYEKSVHIGSHIRFEMALETPGYLLLLQKDTLGKLSCFCPSCFAPKPKLDTGHTILPQEGSPLTSFPIEGAPGTEEILAIITQEEPNLSWLPQGNDAPLELTESHLMQLLEFVYEKENCRILYTEYNIIA
ncbi:MAG: DUF4384 domain-containing protein [Rhizonema sp. NSF051]|nr:DUF4384 domain-containing protein [Rhizonema sp. NSF051]